MTSETDMIFVQRDDSGKIGKVSIEPLPGYEPCHVLREGAPEIAAKFQELAATDLMLVRVLEDLIDLLIKKDLIRFTDLPGIAQHKLNERRSIRTEISGLNLLGEDTDGLI